MTVPIAVLLFAIPFCILLCVVYVRGQQTPPQPQAPVTTPAPAPPPAVQNPAETGAAAGNINGQQTLPLPQPQAPMPAPAPAPPPAVENPTETEAAGPKYTVKLREFRLPDGRQQLKVMKVYENAKTPPGVIKKPVLLQMPDGTQKLMILPLRVGYASTGKPCAAAIKAEHSDTGKREFILITPNTHTGATVDGEPVTDTAVVLTPDNALALFGAPVPKAEDEPLPSAPFLEDVNTEQGLPPLYDDAVAYCSPTSHGGGAHPPEIDTCPPQEGGAYPPRLKEI